MEKNQARSRLKPKKPSLFKKYLRYTSCLFIALLAYFSLYLLLNKVYPSQIQNFLFTNSYLPFFLLLFTANFFLFTFLSLNKNIGFILAFFLNLIVYFQVCNLDFNLGTFLIIIFLTAILTSLLFWEKIQQATKNKNTK